MLQQNRYFPDSFRLKFFISGWLGPGTVTVSLHPRVEGLSAAKYLGKLNIRARDKAAIPCRGPWTHVSHCDVTVKPWGYWGYSVHL